MTHIFAAPAPKAPHGVSFSAPWRGFPRILAIYGVAAVLGSFTFVCVQNLRWVTAPPPVVNKGAPVAPLRGATPASEPASRSDALLASRAKDLEIARLLDEVSRQRTELVNLHSALAILNTEVPDAPKSGVEPAIGNQVLEAGEELGRKLTSGVDPMGQRSLHSIEVKLGDLPTIYETLHAGKPTNDNIGLTVIFQSESIAAVAKKAVDLK